MKANHIEQKIRKIRELKGISQENMAMDLKLSTRAYSKIENGETKLTINRLDEISTILGVSIQEILFFDEACFFQRHQIASENDQYFYAFSEQERVQYENQIEHLRGEIVFLRQQLETILKK